MILRCLRLTFGASVIASFAGLPALAASNCDSFGQSSVGFARHNIEANCGFTGGAWADDYAGHKAWCEQPSVTDAQIAAILSERQSMLLQCMAANKPATATVPQCQNFANAAVAKARDNARIGCGLTGGAYADDYNGHYNWCLQQAPEAVFAANEATNAGIAQCRQDKMAGVCGFYVTAISPLYQQQNEACAGRADFQLVASNPEFDREQCFRNAAPDAVWVNQQVGAMQARIDICRANTVRYDNIGHRGAPLDSCTDDLGAFCGEWVTEDFCEWKGHTKAIDAVSVTTDFTVHMKCLATGNVNAAAEREECFCSGTCGGFTSITCTGRN